MEFVEGFLGWLFETLSGLFSGLLDFLTYNPLTMLPQPVNAGLLATVDFVNQWVPIKAMFAAVASALPWFSLLVVAGIIWRWVRGL